MFVSFLWINARGESGSVKSVKGIIWGLGGIWVSGSAVFSLSQLIIQLDLHTRTFRSAVCLQIINILNTFSLQYKVWRNTNCIFMKWFYNFWNNDSWAWGMPHFLPTPMQLFPPPGNLQYNAATIHWHWLQWVCVHCLLLSTHGIGWGDMQLPWNIVFLLAAAPDLHFYLLGVYRHLHSSVTNSSGLLGNVVTMDLRERIRKWHEEHDAQA